jgi:hypothetical protein
MKNFVEELQRKCNGLLFNCNEAHADLYTTKQKRELYKKQYEELRSLQAIITDIKIKVDQINLML